jgi:NADP-dependent 3-hydroxy acid dehydrogenase YdfG
MYEIKKLVFETINSYQRIFSTIDVLINNAGNAHGLDPFKQGDRGLGCNDRH